ncbi:DUF6600 domain-containing protein [Duganella callida]|uniref:FecR protein domain-containing protein n=1 Tax=Duganella callida TaxID=2561932 RepID=A0A4Y9S764_9BURK|nr:DUF6600 domain-containing protein [Duganella callida]TFW17337.1 hypothetical protein E4L98_20780 [Duganella callida]
MKIIRTAVLAALAGYSAWALADPPVMVGRISSVQGQVTLVGDDEPVAASLNWPVTANNHINTASGARTEFRVGSTAVRVDGDSDLEITAMDDDLLRLRLNYGSVSINVRSPELLRDFELTTPQARITLLEPGVVRVDVDRTPDTSQVSVMAGSARVEGAGSSVVVNNGRHVDITPEDVRTSVARRDGFDIWADNQDRNYQNAVTTTRFVSTGMTGYEELDRNGTWVDNVEYGPLWTPRNVALDWAPYRDGQWIWLAPWGWTWVDNAPWGYAPSHYGRWVFVNRRWCWAPGRPVGRPAWAPALVGWVGGNAGPHHGGPGLGWYPLSPRDRYVPNFRASAEYERRVTWTHNGRPFAPQAQHDDRRDGLTMLPREQFEGRRNIAVHRGAQVIPAPNVIRTATPVAPPQPPRVLSTNRGGMGDRDHDGIPDRFDRNDGRNEVRHDGRGDGRNDWRNDGRNDRPGRVLTAPSQPVPVPVPAQQPRGQISTLAPGQFGERDSRPQTINPNDVRVDIYSRGHQRTPGVAQPQTQVAPAPVLQVSPPQQQPAPQQQPQPPRDRDRFDRGDEGQRRFRPQEDREQREQRQPQQPPRQFNPPPAPAQQPQPQAQPRPEPRQFTPPPAPQPQVQPAPRENREQRREEHERGDRRHQNQQ